MSDKQKRSRLPLPSTPAPSGVWGVCVYVPAHQDYVALLLGALDRLARQSTYERDTAHTAQTVAASWLNALNLTLDEWHGCDCDGSSAAPDILKNITFWTDEDSEEESVEEMNPVWEKRNGTWYAGFICGDCGGREWVALGGGATLSPTASAAGSGAVNLPTGYSPSSVTASCYAGKAVDYLATQVGEMVEFIVDTTGVALDYFDLLTPFTEGFDTVAVLGDLLTGSGTTRELVDAGIATALSTVNNSLNLDALKASWTFTAPPTQSAIVDWVNRTTFPTNPQNLAKATWQLWAARVVMARHANALALMVTECATGADVGSLVPPPSATLVPSVEGLEIWELAGYPQERTYIVGFSDKLFEFDKTWTAVYAEYTWQGLAMDSSDLILPDGTQLVFGDNNGAGYTMFKAYDNGGWLELAKTYIPGNRIVSTQVVAPSTHPIMPAGEYRWLSNVRTQSIQYTIDRVFVMRRSD